MVVKLGISIIVFAQRTLVIISRQTMDNVRERSPQDQADILAQQEAKLKELMEAKKLKSKGGMMVPRPVGSELP